MNTEDPLDPLEVALVATNMQSWRPRPRSILAALAERFGRSKRQIGRVLRAEGVALGTPHRAPPSPEDLHRLYVVEGLSARDIAADCTVSTRTVERWLARHGVRKNG